MSLPVKEFLLRFKQHILPRGFVKIRGGCRLPLKEAWRSYGYTFDYQQKSSKIETEKAALTAKKMGKAAILLLRIQPGTAAPSKDSRMKLHRKIQHNKKGFGS